MNLQRRTNLLLLLGTLALAHFIDIAQARVCVSPEQVHVALAGDSDKGELRFNVKWTVLYSSDQASAISEYVPVLRYGKNPDQLDTVTTGAACKTMSYWPLSYHYDCTSDPIDFETFYYYSVGDMNCADAVSKPALLVKQPKPGSTVSVAILGDLGIDNANATIWNLADQARLGDFSLAIHLGDIAYADDLERSRFTEYEDATNYFFRSIEPITKTVPYLVTPGNHDVTCRYTGDAGCPDALRNFTAYNARWRMPGFDAPQKSRPHANGNMWYSFTYGNIRFISINTESDYPNAPYSPNGKDTKAGGFTGDQIAWLEKELAKAAKERSFDRPWIVVYGHRPLYSSTTLDYPADQQNRTCEVLEPLFLKYGVDLYLSGHLHDYEYTYPMARGQVYKWDFHNSRAPVYIINGAAGNAEGHPTTITPDIPFFEHYRNANDYGYGVIKTFVNPAVNKGAYQVLCHYFLRVTPDSRDFDDIICITKDTL